MKKTLFFLLIVVCFGALQGNAQITTLRVMSGSNNSNPYGSLILSGGKLYGMTELGGQYNAGNLFSIDTNGAFYTDILDFDSTNGARPYGTLSIQGDTLYGMTYKGGLHNSGVVFSIHIDGTGYKNLHDFDTATGANPLGSLKLSGNNLYGMTTSGGTSAKGVIFSLKTNGTEYTVLLNFNVTNGSTPQGSLIIAGNKLFGMSTNGGSGYGAGGDGLVFSLDTTGGGYKTLLTFNGTNGQEPIGDLTILNGVLYGMTESTSNMFSIDTDGTGYKNIITLGVSDAPRGSFTVFNGKLYGMVTSGGTNKVGDVFSMNPDGSGSKDLLDFGSVSYGITVGSTPYGNVTICNNKIYGMTYLGGVNNNGVIFSIDTGGGGYKDMHDFNVIMNGEAAPHGSLTASGNMLYGMTYNGGGYDSGFVFSMCNNGKNFRDLVNLNNRIGSYPYGNLTLLGCRLYGMTSLGGTHDSGTLFSVDTNGFGLNVLFNFTKKYGAKPHGSLLLSSGLFYGMTTLGGTYNHGVIFSMDTTGNNYKVLFNFNVLNGESPNGSLIIIGNKLYGMAYSGGANYADGSVDGTVFSINTDGTGFKDMHDFTDFTYTTNGAGPVGDLVFSNGKLFGMTAYGGVGDGGVIFSIDTNGSDYKGFYSLSAAFPYGNLSLSGNVLFGITQETPGTATAMIFMIDSNGSNYKSLYTFGGSAYTTGSLTCVGNFFYGMNTATGAIFSYKSTSIVSAGFIADTLACIGTPLQFTDMSFGTPTSWNWKFPGGTPSISNSKNPAIIYNTSGIYTATLVVSNFYGTDSITKKINITVGPSLNIGLSANTTICSGTTDTLIASGGTNYSWSDGTTTDTLIASLYLNVTYTLVINNAFCSRDTTLTITVNSIPTLSINGDSIICAGSTTKLTATGANSYLWEPSGKTTAAISVAPATTATYTLIGTSYGCMNATTRTVSVFSSNGFDIAGNLQVCIDTPSFNNTSIQACIYNNRCMPVNGTLKLLLDTALHFTSTIADSNAHISGDTLIWNFDSLSDISKTQCVSLNGTISNLPVGDSVFVSMFITPVVGDSNPANNSITYWVKAFPYNCVGIPFDPNEKSVSPIGDIADTQKLTYTIHFQNTGTAIAHNVVVIDTLSANLDATTLKTISASNDVSTQIVSGHIVKFIFDNINLPDTGTSKTTSIGLFTYTVKPLAGLSPGDQIINRAGIYFDSNPVITTNKTVNTIAGSPLNTTTIFNTNNLACFPNPFSSSTSIVFNTAGNHYIELFDVTGRIIENIQCTSRQYELQRNNLASGVYYIKAFDAEQKYLTTLKLIIL